MTPQLMNLQTMSDQELQKFYAFSIARNAEYYPEDPVTPYEDWVRRWREPAPHDVSRRVAIVHNQTVIGVADADWRDNDTENPDQAWTNVSVDPAFMRQGYGTKLLHVLLEEIQPLGRKKLFCGTSSIKPGGKPFAEKMGAKFGLEEGTNQLLFSEMDVGYLQRSLEQAPKDRFSFIWFDSDYPEDDATLQKLCDMFAVMNTAPRGDLEFNDWKATPEKLRDEAANAKKHQQQWWLCIAVENTTGNFAGFTETGWHHNRPKVAGQYGTGVDPTYRGHGLGAWLKAAMIDRILRERPTVDRIRTGNADSNVPMLKINHSLGFKPYHKHISWQIDVAKTLEILRTQVQ